MFYHLIVEHEKINILILSTVKEKKVPKII